MEKLKYGLISCDFDDTLLRSDDTISQYTREVIAEYTARGGVFMPNTGRMHASIKQRIGDIGLVGNFPISSFQGAMVRENETDREVIYLPLERKLAAEIARDAEERKLYVQTYAYDTLILSSIYGEMSFGTQYAERLRLKYDMRAQPISEVLFNGDFPVTKLLVAVPPEDMPRILPEFIAKYPGATMNSSKPYMMEIISKDAGKHIACDLVCRSLGLTIESCMALGDSLNDYTMIEHAGFSVVMENGVDELKAIADYITDTNDRDGVAKAIEKFCL